MMCERCSSEATIFVGIGIALAPGVVVTREVQVCTEHAPVAVATMCDAINAHATR